MRILHFDFDDLGNPWGGGQARRTREVNRALAFTRGWEITVVTGTYAGAVPHAEAVANGRLRYLRLGAGPFPLNILSFIALQPFMARLVDHDLIVEDFTTPVGPTLAPRWSRAPVIGSAQFLFANQMARKYRLPFDRLATALLPAYRHLIALTNHGAETLRRESPRATVTVIPQGLDPGDFAVPESGDPMGAHVLYIGRLDRHQKGIDTLLHAWGRMSPSVRPPLVIAGDGRERDALRALTTTLGLDHSVRFAGRVAGEPKRALFRDARIVCLPSRYETYGITAIEALAAERALVATDIPEFREVASEGGILVPPDDPDALGHACLDLWHDHDRRLRLARRGRDAVAGRTWDAVATAQGDFYEAAMRGTRAPGNVPAKKR